MGRITTSYVSGASEHPLIGATVGQLFARQAEATPDLEALVSAHQRVRYSYRELAEQVDAFAAGLLATGLEPGDRVGIWSPNNAEWVITQFATARAGLILVTVNPAYRLSELEYVLNKVGCTALVLAPQFKTSDYAGMVRELAPELTDCTPGALQAKRLPHLRSAIVMGNDAVPGMYRFADIPPLGGPAQRKQIAELHDTLQFDAPINIQFTSGTTGLPKGATLTHHNIVNNAFFVCDRLGATAGDRICIPVPLYHCFGMVLGTLGCVAKGATMVLPGEAFDPGAVLETVQQERCTILYGVPTMFIAELGHPEFARFDLSSLRTGIMAGAPCPVEVMKKVRSDMHMEDVTIAYGMTETSPVSFQGFTDDPLEKRVGTVGAVMPHVEAKIVDEQNRIVPAGTPGEFCARGYCVMQGYWDDPDRTAECIDDHGWMHSGDIAVLDEDGYCNIVGRIKDMVIRGGENIYPREVEEFLHGLDVVADVQVFGVPDEKFGEELCAWIKLAEGAASTADHIRDQCKGQIAHYKIPRYIEFVDDFPMTVSGKAQKFLMREAMVQRLQLAEVKTA